MGPTIVKLLPAAQKLFFGLFALCLIGVVYLSSAFTKEPTEAQPESGHTLPFDNVGTTYYITEQENAEFKWLNRVATIAIMAAIGASIARHKLQNLKK